LYRREALELFPLDIDFLDVFEHFFVLGFCDDLLYCLVQNIISMPI